MSPLRTGGLFLALSCLVGLIWFWVELGSPVVYFLSPWLFLIDVVAAGLIAGLGAVFQRRKNSFVAAWLPPALVFVIAVFAFNGFFVPELDGDYLKSSISLALANIGLPGLICALLAHLRARRVRPASTLKSADVETH